MEYAPPKLKEKLRECLTLFAKVNRLARQLPADSFLNFYRVIELVAGELHKSSAKSIRESSPTINDLTELDIIGQRTQKMTVYFVIRALNLEGVSLKDAIKVADKRNRMAHSAEEPDGDVLKNYMQLAYSVFLEFTLRLSQSARID
jgi:hypothetical protein